MTNIFPKRHGTEAIVLGDSLPPSRRAQTAFLILFTKDVSTGTTATSFNKRKLRRSGQAWGYLAHANNSDETLNKVDLFWVHVRRK